MLEVMRSDSDAASGIGGLAELSHSHILPQGSLDLVLFLHLAWVWGSLQQFGGCVLLPWVMQSWYILFSFLFLGSLHCVNSSVSLRNFSESFVAGSQLDLFT